MPDIAMCRNKQCKKRKKCYRFMAKPNEPWQTYGDFKPDINGECEDFWKNKSKGGINTGYSIFGRIYTSQKEE